MKLIECVPNISEGRDKKIIEEIEQAIASVKDAYLLHKDIGHGVNRTVLTIAGSPEAVYEAAFQVISKTSELIDMRGHKGSHPRIGATDVCPIIPLSDTSMAECVELSKKLAYRVGTELHIPVYLYGESAQVSERKSLSYIRGGEYENLFLRIDELVFKPDYGPIICNARSGATAIGAEPSYIAYNISLNTKDLKIAKTIAQKIRDMRQHYAQPLSVASISETQKETQLITWQESQAIGWYIQEYGHCQISTNLLDYKKTSLYDAYMGVSQLASEHGISVLGSEIIGLLPLAALLDVGKSVFQKKINNIAESQLIEAAIQFLNLDAIQPFRPQEKVLEYRLKDLVLK